MSVRSIPSTACADLGDIWLRDQRARLAHKQVLFGRYFQMDTDALLAHLADHARAARAVAVSAAAKAWAEDRARPVTIGAVEHRDRRDVRFGDAVAVAIGPSASHALE